MNLVTLNLTQNKSQPTARSAFRDGLDAGTLDRLDPISRAERTLNGLPDELLADMGIKRSEIADAVRFGRGDDRRAALRRRSSSCAGRQPPGRRPRRPARGLTSALRTLS